MVLWNRSQHIFNTDFKTVSLAFFNRYPNPYAHHVLSIDTLSREIDPTTGELVTTRIIKKAGKLPEWIKPFLGKISESWIIEISKIDKENLLLTTYTKNLDHTKIIKVEEYTTYKYDNKINQTLVESNVKFSSGFGRMNTFRNRIEQWSHEKFTENIKKSRLGMKFVIDQYLIKSNLN
ncbi:probable Protein UPS1, mitochondrial [Saccharomycodes ludwigii]|uniref:Probable Protein UPS1, mitochondrial n=1 Tax=Saccharomycodes ludwigii TaxID=36035 RepID=A0A376B3T9_9ASCO|nr:hypothetical protein SCDLUD_000219 [Saccharomycodes ludwigii]KAH3902638.1 hypothetical protein SCDLUD_000219 [Saccharomycodes ludwigii]SSD59321.1 probable Protein UPS1, mitochondrial [Saccharomycodes ludwigii]